MIGTSDHSFVRNSSQDKWWRKNGHWIYLATLGAVLMWVPTCVDREGGIFKFLQEIPAIHSLMKSSEAPCRIISWAVASVVLYPILHASLRSRLRAANFTLFRVAAIVFSIAIVDVMLILILFWGDIGSVSGRGVARAWLALIKSDGIGFLFSAIPVSVTYSFMVFISLHIISLPFLNRK